MNEKSVREWKVMLFVAFVIMLGAVVYAEGELKTATRKFAYNLDTMELQRRQIDIIRKDIRDLNSNMKSLESNLKSHKHKRRWFR